MNSVTIYGVKMAGDICSTRRNVGVLRQGSVSDENGFPLAAF